MRKQLYKADSDIKLDWNDIEVVPRVPLPPGSRLAWVP